MFSSRERAVLLTLTVAAMAACSRNAPAGPRRIALLPFENLTADAGLSWLSRAAPDLLAQQIRGERLLPLEVAGMREPAAARATETVYGYFEHVGNDLRVSAAVQDAQSHRTLRVAHAQGPKASGIVPIIDSVARQLTDAPSPPPSRNEEAIRTLYDAASKDTAGRIELTRRAVELDPSFATAWVGHVQALLAANDTAGARAAAERAQPHLKNFTPLERARFALLSSIASPDMTARARAMEQYAGEAKEADAWRQLAELQMLRKEFKAAAAAYERAAAIEPASIALWNQLGYARAFAGDLPGAVQALDRYRAIAPGDANAIDSLGEVHFMAGRFQEAERYFLEAHSRNAALLNGGEPFRAALSRALAGDPKGARDLYAKYAAGRPNDPNLPLREAIFLYMSGDTQGGESAARKLAPGDALAQAQLSIWMAARGKLDEAAREAAAALRQARLPVAKTLATVAAAVAAERTPANMPASLEAYRLLFRQSPEAEALWTRLYDATSATTGSDVRVMWLWAKRQPASGPYPMPPQHPEPGLQTLTLPKFLELKR